MNNDTSDNNISDNNISDNNTSDNNIFDNNNNNNIINSDNSTESNIQLKTKLYNPVRKTYMNAKYAIHRVGHKKWDIISKNIGPEINVWRNLYNEGKCNTITNNTSQKPMYCGEDLYLAVRTDLINNKIICNESSKSKSKNIGKELDKKTAINTNRTKNKGKKGNLNKAEKIKQENLLKKIKTDLISLIKSIGSIGSDPVLSDKPIVFTEKFSEFLLVRMMIQCRNLLSKYLASATKLTKRDIIEMIIGYGKIIVEKKEDLSISKTCLEDLETWINYAKSTINFDTNDVIINMPELIFKTVYDNMLINKQIGLYPSQKDIFKFITTTDKYLVLVHTMLGSGKTSMVLPICGWLTMSKLKIKPKLIFCCPNEVVLLEVAHMVYGMGLSFAIIIHEHDKDDIKTSKLVYKWSSFADKKNPKDSSVLYLCDVFIAHILMEERNVLIKDKMLYLDAYKRDPINYPLIEDRIPYIPDYILMCDELTKDADSQKGFMIDSGFSVTTELFIKLMKIAPPKIILMSATLPTASQLPNFYQSIIKANPGMIMKSFSSSEAKIGCALISSTGRMYAPHMGCQTVAEIVHLLDLISTNPFIGRFYTFEILTQMVSTFKNAAIEYPDLATIFENPSDANQTAIQQIAYSMLQTLVSQNSDTLICQVCALDMATTKKGVDLSTILTTDISRFNKGCLIFSNDPVKTAINTYKANFDNFFSETATTPTKSIFKQVKIDKILDKYYREMENYEKNMSRVEEKKDPGVSSQNKQNDKKERVTVDSWCTKSMMTSNKPIWEFPLVLQLCSTEHLHRSKCFAKVAANGLVEPEDLPQPTSVSYDILTMLASGVGIYSTKSDSLDDEYLKTVLFLAKKGVIKTIFTDSSIAYGTNLAVSDIVILDENSTDTVESIVDQHSIKTIFQMLGRAGRGGNLSYEARVYTTSAENNLINKINAYVKGTLDEGRKDEIININQAYEILW